MRCRRWLTQRMPSDWRPSTRATVAASPASSASRRSGPSAFDTERATAQRSVDPASVHAFAPATAPPWSSSITSTSGCARSSGPQLARAALVERRAERILRARGDDEPVRRRARAPSRRRRGSGPGVVDADRHRGHAQRREQVEDGGKARVLDRDPIARPQPGGEHPLDAVERAAHHGERLDRDRRPPRSPSSPRASAPARRGPRRRTRAPSRSRAPPARARAGASDRDSRSRGRARARARPARAARRSAGGG